LFHHACETGVMKMPILKDAAMVKMPIVSTAV
jgi:hypothetical protein